MSEQSLAIISPCVIAVIPAWNEEGNIGRVIADVPHDLCSHVIVADNASTDGTALAARSAGAIVVEQPKRGYGYACAAGARKALQMGADIIVFLDGDYSDYPEDMRLLVEPILDGKADMVLGSRLSGGKEARRAVPAHAAFGNRLITVIMRLRFRLRITDLGPFRAIRADTLHKLNMSEMTYGWPMEMIIKSVRRKLRIREVPVRYRKRLSGQSKVSGNIGASVKAGWCILSVTFRHAL